MRRNLHSRLVNQAGAQSLQREMATRSGLERKHLFKTMDDLYNGEGNPNLDTIIRLHWAFGGDVADLFSPYQRVKAIFSERRHSSASAAQEYHAGRDKLTAERKLVCKNLSDWLRKSKRSQKLTVKELAARLGKSKRAVERQRQLLSSGLFNPSLETVVRLYVVHGLPAEEMFLSYQELRKLRKKGKQQLR
ncbi:MAG: hypothetical protein QM796_18520 [Chthoniobacteraceae bacterium]